LHVLLADDNLEIRSALHLLLDELGHSISDATDVSGLFTELQKGPTDMLLLDWELPGFVPGIHMHDILLDNPRCVVVAMSGRPEARAESGRLGVEAFVSKSDPPDALLRILRETPIRWETAE
jgi:CheY-like chemotaxis protein